MSCVLESYSSRMVDDNLQTPLVPSNGRTDTSVLGVFLEKMYYCTVKLCTATKNGSISLLKLHYG